MVPSLRKYILGTDTHNNINGSVTYRVQSIIQKGGWQKVLELPYPNPFSSAELVTQKQARNHARGITELVSPLKA